MTKKILAALLASAMVLSLAGCNESSNGGSNGGNSGNEGGNSGNEGGNGGNEGGSNEGGNASGSAEDVLTIVTWGSNSDVVKMVQVFCEKTGTPEDKVQIVTQGDNGEGGRDNIQQYLKGDGDADIITLEADWILSYIADDNLVAPLSDVGISESDLADPYSYTVAIGKTEDGVLKGVSFQATPGGFLYRADLASQYLNVNSPEEMQAKVSDWSKFQATAKELYEASGGQTSLQATSGGLWQVYQYNKKEAWVVDGALVMGSAEDFYDIAKTFADEHYNALLPQWDAAWYAGVIDGAALGDFVPTWGLTTASDSILTQMAGGETNMAFCAGPNSYAWGGTWLGLAAKHNTDDLAAQFIKFFTCDPEGMRAYTDFTNDFCNNKTVMKAVVDEGTNSNPQLKDGQDQFQILLGQADAINMDGKITKYDSVIKGHFNDSVNGYVDGTYGSKEEAIEAFKNNVAASFPDLVVE